MAANVGTGTTVTFGTSSFTADVLSVSRSGITRESIETTHLGTATARTFMVGDLYDAGELSMEIAWIGSLDPPYDGVAETITIDYAGAGSGHRWAASGFITSLEMTAGIEERMTATITIKYSGTITQN